MKYLLAAFVLIFAFASVSFAKLMYIPLEEAVKNSDLIVVGTLKNISERKEEHVTFGTGEIFVERFIAGNVKTVNGFALTSGDRLRLDYVEHFVCVMGSHRRIENEKGVYLLTLNDDGSIKSKDFRPLEALAEIEKLLKKDAKNKGFAKRIKVEADQLPAYENPNGQIEQVNICTYSVIGALDYRPIATLLVVLGSVALYYVLYRSRFRIR